MYGEDKFVVVFGGLHKGMSGLRTMGDWLQGSGRVEALVQAEITTTGTADSFLPAASDVPTKSQRLHCTSCSIGLTLTVTQIQKLRVWDLRNGAQRGKRAALNTNIGQQSCHWSCVYWSLCGPTGSPPSACTSMF